MHLLFYIVLQVVTDPFFTNDIKGMIRLGGFALTILGPLFFVVFRLVFNSTVEKLKGLESSLNGYGERLGKQETAQTACSTKIGAVEAQMGRHEIEVRGIALSQAKVETKVEEMARQQVALQRDVMEAVTESGRQLTSAITDLKLDVRGLSERDKLGSEFGKAMAEIAEIMRDNQRTARNQREEPRGRS